LKYNLLTFIPTYIGLPAASSLLVTGKVAVCPASDLQSKKPAGASPINFGVSYQLPLVITNAFGPPAETLNSPFGYPGASGGVAGWRTDDSPLKVVQILRPAEIWASCDVDKKNTVASTTTGYGANLPEKKVHGSTRNKLFFDWHVAAVREEP
jgi:prepilin-type processing-associated H-X9-DG protein